MEEKEAQMVALCGGKPYSRVAHFLKPSFPNSQQHQTTTNSSPISHPTKPMSMISKLLSSKVQFNVWQPLKDWSKWVEKLLPLYKSTWEKLSIYEAIMGSKCDIPKCKDSIFTIAEKWCFETNSFVFKWGEVTITLEDIMVLGGYSVTGDSVLSKISSTDLHEIRRKLDMVYTEIRKTKAKKVSHYQWMNVWMNKGGEFEHEAFLTLWLSRYVLPAYSGMTINKKVFSIAILLAGGTKVAIAPAVLASIYRDLRLLKEKIATLREIGDHDAGSKSELHLCSPLQLLQVWVWERFTALSPKPNHVTNDLPTLHRWHKVKIPKNDDVGLAFDSAVESFRWRPYGRSLGNRSVSAKLYAEKASWVSVTSHVSLDLESYARIVRNSKLVGLNCAEQYLPHRVSMQFGLDQDIPRAFPRVRGTLDFPWNNYDRPIGDVKLYIPSKLYRSDVTARYLEWWNKSNGRVAAEYSSDQLQPSSKGYSRSPCGFVVDIGSSDSDASPSSSQVNEVKVDDDGTYDDHLTLKEFFVVKGTPKTNRSATFSVNHDESPLSSAGYNFSNEEQKLVTENTGNIVPDEECTSKERINEDGIEMKADSRVKSPLSTNRNENRTIMNGNLETSDIEILNRIARLQRIVDIVKAEKASQV